MSSNKFSIAIPEQHKPIFQKLISLSDKAIKKIISDLNNIAPTKMPEKIINSMSKSSILSKKELSNLIGLIFSLCELQRRDNVKVDELVDALHDYCEISKDEKFYPKGKNWNTFKKRLQELLDLNNNIILSVKSLSIATDHKNTFCTSRIYTDIRPIFSNDITTQKPKTVIYHNLKIVSHEGGEHKELFVALDLEDLKQLKNQITRAEKKEEYLKKVLNESKLITL
ncbi:hypothetical protein ACFL57_05405 [Candidatus Margulisiibacteriota bacterium]